MIPLRDRLSQPEWLAQQFDDSRSHLRAVAYQMLGSLSQADDAVQEAWLKVARSGSREVENLKGWLTTIVARVCMDMLRSRQSRREESLAPSVAEVSGAVALEGGVGLADAIGPALLVVLDKLAPPERIAFVLHDVFDLSFEEIAPIVDRTPAAARQLASRARRRVRGASTPRADVARHGELVSAFLAASRDGDLQRLLALLSPDVVLRSDELAVQTAAANQHLGSPMLARELRGAQRVAEALNGRARGASAVLIDGEPGAASLVRGQVRAAFVFEIAHGQIVGLEVIMEPLQLAELDVQSA